MLGRGVKGNIQDLLEKRGYSTLHNTEKVGILTLQRLKDPLNTYMEIKNRLSSFFRTP